MRALLSPPHGGVLFERRKKRANEKGRRRTTLAFLSARLKRRSRNLSLSLSLSLSQKRRSSRERPTRERYDDDDDDDGIVDVFFVDAFDDRDDAVAVVLRQRREKKRDE